MALNLRTSLRNKLVAINAATLLVVACTIIAVLSTRMATASREGMEERAREVAAVLANATGPGLEFDDAPTVLSLLDGLGAARGALYAAVYRFDGTVFATWKPERVPKDPPARAEGGKPVLIDRRGELEVVVPVAVKTGKPGVLRIGFTLAELDAQRRTDLLVTAAVALALLLAGLGAAYALGTLVGLPIRTIAGIARQIAQGDLKSAGEALESSGIATGGSGGSGGREADEVRQLAYAFREMLAALRNASVTLLESASLLGASVERLGDSSASQREVVSRQAAALHEVSATAQELKQTSEVAVQQANAVLEVSRRADGLRQSGDLSIEQTLAALSDIKAQVQAIAEHVGGLGEKTAQVGGITEAVKDLADQSSLLALNASIEAARAGEQGKGFAVVANEVRLLAAQSGRRTDEVRRVLLEIVGSTKSAIALTEEGVARVHAGLGQAQTSGQSLRDLSTIVQESAGAGRQIAGVMQQQNQGIEQVLQAIAELTQMMEDTVARIGETARVVETVAVVSGRVLGVAQRYKI
ncbi:MAG TPA: methyl-accepting chemotaxis protein [Myxococcales bacterium]|jgi:methyl-accepting chemotaxis protein